MEASATEYRCTIDRKCIGCNACVVVAPRCFARHGAAIAVERQPDSLALLRDAREAQAACPVGAVGIAVLGVTAGEA